MKTNASKETHNSDVYLDWALSRQTERFCQFIHSEVRIYDILVQPYSRSVCCEDALPEASLTCAAFIQPGQGRLHHLQPVTQGWQWNQHFHS